MLLAAFLLYHLCYVTAQQAPPVTTGLTCYLSADTYQTNQAWKTSGECIGDRDLQRHAEMPVAVDVNDYNSHNFKTLRFKRGSGMIIDRLSVPAPYTIFLVDRYTSDAHDLGRTLQSRTVNWLLGRWSSQVTHYAEGWVTSAPLAATRGLFGISVAMMSSNNNAVYYYNGFERGTRPGSTPPGTLGLCAGGVYDHEDSDADVSTIIVYNRVLEPAERSQVEWFLAEKYGIQNVKPLGVCKDNNGGCDPLADCIDVGHSRKCGACPTGYTGAGDSKCVDNDECKQNNGGCDTHVKCTNTPGSFRCDECPHGFTGPPTACRDINECDIDNGGCHPSVACTNTDGGRKCGSCLKGYEGNGDGSEGCRDVNECLGNGGKGPCDPLTTCTNLPGTYKCGVCPEGIPEMAKVDAMMLMNVII